MFGIVIASAGNLFCVMGEAGAMTDLATVMEVAMRMAGTKVMVRIGIARLIIGV